jgi:alanine racemase
METGSIKKQHPHGLRTWIEIDTKAVDHNLSLVRGLMPERTQLMAVVKSNAYGHGLLDFSSYVISKGVPWIGVDSIVEATAIRKTETSVRMLILGYTLPEYIEEAAKGGISLTVSTMETLKEIQAAEYPGILKIHIKVDTGMYRQGFLPADIPAEISELSNMKNIEVEGLYTHFSDAKRVEGTEFSKEQRRSFDEVCGLFSAAGFTSMVHANASPGLLRFGASAADGLVRCGALLYGIWPSPDMKKEFGGSLPISPALSWKAIVTEIKMAPKGAAVGYGRSEALSRDSKLAICPVGYWHGYHGTLASKGIVMIQGEQVKVVGKVSMDMLILDCTNVSGVKAGDVVTLIDSDPDSPASAENVAENAGVSVHELVTCLNSRIRRIYTSS